MSKEKEFKGHITPVGRATFVALNKPYAYKGEGTPEYRMKLMLDPSLDSTKEFLTSLSHLKGLRSVKKVVANIDGEDVPRVQVTAKSRFQPAVININQDVWLDGKEVSQSTELDNIYTNLGDTFECQLMVSEYIFDDGSSFNLNGVTVHNIDRTTRHTEPDLKAPSEKTLESLMAAVGSAKTEKPTEARVAALKG